MRKTILTLVPAIGLLLSVMASAQGTLYVSNLGQTPTGSAPVASDTWRAVQFSTGADSGGYVLNSVQLLMDAASGSPIGFNISIYSSLNPVNNLGSLSGLDPSAGGLFTYNASGFELSPSTAYYIVLTAASPMAQGTYVWSAANTGSYSSSDGWSLGIISYSSTDGSIWAGSRTGPGPFQFAVNATSVPEPTTYALAGLGLAALSFWRRKP